MYSLSAILKYNIKTGTKQSFDKYPINFNFVLSITGIPMMNLFSTASFGAQMKVSADAVVEMGKYASTWMIS